MRPLVLALALLTPAVAAADEPVVERGKDSTITGHVDVAVAPEAAYALVVDPVAVARIDGSIEVSATPDGVCQDLDILIDHPLAKARYTTRSCPEGELVVRQWLTGGDAMKEYETRWRVEALETGSRLHYRIRTIPAMAVPQAIVDRLTVKGARRLLERLRDHLEGEGS